MTTAISGVSEASPRAKRFERRLALTVVALPFIGCCAAMVLLFDRGVSSVDVVLLVGMYSVSVFGIGIGYHRLLTHRSFDTKPFLRVLFAIMGSTAAQGPVLYWTSVHRRHHAHADKEGDPHSPHLHTGSWRSLRGFWHAHVGWLFHHEITDIGRFVPDLLRDRGVFGVSQSYFLWVLSGLALPAAIGGAFGGPTGALSGFVWGGLVRIALVQHTTWAINSVCHVIGTRPLKCRDLACNNALVAIFSFGEGWHNNHHSFPTSAIHGFEWWQYDLSGLVIRTLEKLGLAWNVKVPAQSLIDAARKTGEEES
jgi:stearoyl-CoA desaturase (Delta-9 desaturase)